MMPNNTRNQSKIRWSNNELSSLSLWKNQGLPIEEIAKKLDRSVSSVISVINNKRGLLVPPGFIKKNALVQKNNAQALLYDNIKSADNLIMLSSIVQVNPNHYEARALLILRDLIKFNDVLFAEFNTIEACHRWFESLPDQFIENP